MNRKRRDGIVIIGGLAAIGTVIAFTVIVQLQNAQLISFTDSYDRVVFDANTLTHDYQSQVALWKAKQYTNSTMLKKFDNYLPRYQALLDRAESLHPSEKYISAKDFLIKAIKSEIQSNEHFRNYLVTGDPSEYRKSDDLLQNSLDYSIQADSARAVQ